MPIFNLKSRKLKKRETGKTIIKPMTITSEYLNSDTEELNDIKCFIHFMESNVSFKDKN